MIGVGVPEMDALPSRSLPEALSVLDRLIADEVERMRRGHHQTLEEFVHEQVSEEQMTSLLDQRLAHRPHPGNGRVDLEDLVQSAGHDRWWVPIEGLGLTPVERVLVLLALATEFHVAYEAMFAYLNGDATHTSPTVDLAMRLLGSEPHAAQRVRALLSSSGTLRSRGILLTAGSDARSRSSLRLAFSLHPLVIAAILGLPLPVPSAVSFGCGVEPATGRTDECGKTQCAGLVRLVGEAAGGARIVVVRAAHPIRARAGANEAASREGRPLQWIDATAVHPDGAADTARDAALCGALTGSLIALWADDVSVLRPWIEVFERNGDGPTLVATRDDAAVPVSPFVPTVEMELRPLAPDVCKGVWETLLRREGVALAATDLNVLSERFELDVGEIASTITAARTGNGTVDFAGLARAATRRHATDLQGVAQRIDRPVGWEHLVVPSATMHQLRHAVSTIRHRATVTRSLGMGNHSGDGGVAIVFAGPSGTGKTLAASVIAHDLELDLHRVNLAAVVSKYIGETEKNLDRVFAAAQRTGTMLLFDEADALFGKRSDVRDAHDRYANLEVAFLLQRLELHRGPVVLATNLRQHIDQAFARRFAAMIDFPKPGPVERVRLWDLVLGTRIVRDPGLDIETLSDTYALTGGEIAAVALDAGTRVSAHGGPLTMDDVVAAIAQLYPEHVRAHRPG